MRGLSALLGVVIATVPLPAAEVDYLRDVKPILSARCYSCHGAIRQKAALRLDAISLIRKGGKHGLVVVPGKANASLLIEAVLGEERPRMPPEQDGEALPEKDIAVLKAWIEQGAKGADEPIPEDPRNHWAFRPPVRPELPRLSGHGATSNPIDAFVTAEWDRHGLQPNPAAGKEVLLRRAYLDLVGLPPTRDELHAFLADNSPTAYEKVVDRLLASPRYGERWARHWMDVWRYSDWYGLGAQVRNSRKHLWHWRDWIIEALNEDKGYDRMIVEMLAADEVAPTDEKALRATGYLARNWYLFNRTVWLQDTVEHTGMAFLGLTLKCTRCHDHKFDPIAQQEYYQFRAFFEPHQVRDDRLPGEPDRNKDALPRVYDADLDTPTYLFRRGNEKDPDRSRPLTPGVPAALSGPTLNVVPVSLPRTAYCPDQRDFVVRETLAASVQAVAQAREHLRIAQRATASAVAQMFAPGVQAAAVRLALACETLDALALAELEVPLTERRHTALLKVLRLEQLEDAGHKDSEEWKTEARAAVSVQRDQAVLEARKALLTARKARAAKKVTEAEQALAQAEAALKSPPATAYKPRVTYPHTERFLAAPLDTPYPQTSTGRRRALAQWIAHRQNPLTARVAVNHIWLRHFGSALVPSVFNFGVNGKRPSHPALLDFLAVEFMERNWSMKTLHRMIVTSNAYRLQSTVGGNPSQARDGENRYLWRMNARRMEAELVRDSALHLAGRLDPTMGGPEIDLKRELTSWRRSLYFQHAQDKQMLFLQLFDAAGINECYKRDESIVPQQALALGNSPLMLAQARLLSARLNDNLGKADFIQAAFEQVLGRPPTAPEQAECARFLELQTQLYQAPAQPDDTSATPPCPVRPATEPHLRARESLVHVLLNHNDFITIR